VTRERKFLHFGIEFFSPYLPFRLGYHHSAVCISDLDSPAELFGTLRKATGSSNRAILHVTHY